MFRFAISVLLTSCAAAQSFSASTIAGRSRITPSSTADNTPFRAPGSLAIDPAGNLYVSDPRDNRVLRMSPDRKISVVAGTGEDGFSGDGGPATAAMLYSPTSIAFDSKNNNLFIVDAGNSLVRKVNMATGTISSVAANEGYFVASTIAVTRDGDLIGALGAFMGKVTPAGVLTIIAGNGQRGYSGDNGPGAQAQFSGTSSIAVMADGGIVFIDDSNYRIRRIDPTSGIITTFVGNGQQTIFYPTEGAATSIQLNTFFGGGLFADTNGDLLISLNGSIKKLTGADKFIRTLVTGVGYSSIVTMPNGDIVAADRLDHSLDVIRGTFITRYAGSPSATGPALDTLLDQPTALLVAPEGPWVSDSGWERVLSLQGTEAKIRVDETSALSALARDVQGTLYGFYSSSLLRFGPTQTTYANITQVLIGGGSLNGFTADSGGIAGNQVFNVPMGMVADSGETLYVADTSNCRIRSVRIPTMTTVVGSGTPPPRPCGDSGDNGPATSARLTPFDVTLDAAGNLLIVDQVAHRVRRVNMSTKIITTIAGNGTSGYSGDGGQATAAQLNAPTGVAADSSGNIFIADNGNHVVRMITPNGVIRTIAGSGARLLNKESGPGLTVAIDPYRIAAEPSGTVVFTDRMNDRVRRLTPVTPSSLTIVSGNNQSGGNGSKLTLVAKVVDGSGQPLGGAIVNFTVTAGTATLSGASALTDALGQATVQVTLSTAGAVRVTAASNGVSSVIFNLTATGGAPAPSVDSGGVVGAGLSSPAIQALSTNGIASVFGSNFGAGATFQKVAASDLVNGRVPTVFKGICVEVGGKKAPVFGASNAQVTFQAPTVAASGQVGVVVVTGCGTANEQRSASINIAARGASPEFFYFAFTANGHNPVAATDSITGAILVAPTQFPGAGFRAAKPGGFVTIYGTGFGSTNPAVAAGVFPPSVASVTRPVRVLLNGVELPAANVLYTGVTPNSPGLFQLNIQLPANTPTGDLSLVVEIGGVQSSPGGYLTVAP